MSNSPKGKRSHSNQTVTKNRKAQGIGAYTGIMAMYMLATVITKVVGFGRDIILMNKIPNRGLTDAYILGFSVPDLIYRLLVGGAISAAVTPILSSAIEKDEEDKVWKPISTFFTMIIVISFALIALGQIFAVPLVQFMNKGKSQEIILLAAEVSRIIYFQTFFFILIALATAILSANKVFGLPVFGDTIYNLVCFLVLVFFAENSPRGIKIISWGIVLAAVCYFLYMFYFAKPYFSHFRPNFEVKDPVFKGIVRLAIPILIAGSAMQINLIVQQTFAKQFEGAVTYLNKAQTLYNLPYQIIVVSIVPLMLPNLSGFFAREDYKSANQFYSKTLRTILFMLVPCVVLFIVCAEDTVRAVYQWNPASFTDIDVFHTSELLRVYAINMFLAAVSYLIEQIFFAHQLSWISLVSGLTTLALNPLFCHLYVNVLNLGIQGLTLATCSFNFVMIFVCLWLKHKFVPQMKTIGMGRFIVELVVGAAFTVGATMLMNALLPQGGGKAVQLGFYIIKGCTALGSYFLATHLMRMPEVKDVGRIFGKFFGRKTAREAV